MSNKEKGGRWGWILGLLGASLWLPLLSVSLLLKSDLLGGAVGLLLYGVIVALIFLLRPWHHPTTPLWRLYLGVMVPILAAALFFVWRYRMFLETEENYTFLIFALFPLLLPVFLIGGKSWKEL